MINKANGVINSQDRTSPQTKGRKNGRVNIGQTASVFKRSARKVLASRVTKPEVRTIEGKDLSSRKIVWLEKMKHRWNVFACSFRLVFHLHFGSESRVELKKSRDISKAQLEVLKCKDSRQSETEKLQEAIEDGQPGDVIRSVANIGRAAIGEGGNRVREWWLKI